MNKYCRKFACGLAVALGFFAALEGILWISGVTPLYERDDPYVGFAGHSPLFIEKRTPEEEQVFARADGKMDWFNYQQFPVRKASGVTRVFCLGGSTTYGRPYDDRTSFCGWLRAFLPAVDPDRQWEVINAGGVSYASYRVVRLMEELVDHEPDLFIIYTGHNEFLERRTYERILRTPEFVRDLSSLASRLRIYSLLFDLIHGTKKEDVLPTEVDTILDHSVGPEDYHRDDAMRDAVLEHFRAGLERMTRIGQRAGAEMIFVTPASNTGDFSPFKAEPGDGLDAAQIDQIKALKESASEIIENDPGHAADLVAQALAMDSRDAELLFLHGSALRGMGRMAEARDAFIAARDEDVAPLRALTDMIGIVADVARDNDAGLVDFAKMMEESSADGITGDELFLDHVHPSIEGHRMLALALIDEMIRMEAVTSASTWDETARSEIAARVRSSVDETANAMALANLSKVLAWAGKHKESMRFAERAVSVKADHHTVFQKAGMLRLTGRNEEALPYSEQAVRLMPDVAIVRRDHGVLLATLGRNEEARLELEAAAELDPTMTGLYYSLALVLSDLGHTDQAEKTYRKALEIEPEHAEACNNLGVLLAKRGDYEGAMPLFERAVAIEPEHPIAVRHLRHVRGLLGQ